VLARIADRVKGMGWEQIRASADLHNFLVETKQSMPQVESVFLVDPAGFVAVSSQQFPTPAFDGRDREYFTGSRNANARFANAPFRGGPDGTLALGTSTDLNFKI
jgi:hypothetical protein